jgi:CrcB protein
MNAAMWAGVAVLGGIGATARFLIDSLVSSRTQSALPLGTFVVNVTGSLLLGLLVGLAVGGELLVLAGAATLGSYTTFSTWMLETRLLAENAKVLAAIVNVLLSLAAGIAAAAVGRAIGGQL